MVISHAKLKKNERAEVVDRNKDGHLDGSDCEKNVDTNVFVVLVSYLLTLKPVQITICR